MALTLLQNYHAAVPNGLTVPFGASGGTPPYTFSVVAPVSPIPPAGGTIDPSSGLYTTPSNSTGTDIIQVTDSLAATAQGTMLVDYPLSLVCDIIQTSMGLSNGQVYLWDQKIFIPTDSRLYIAVGVQNCKAFGNYPKYAANSGLAAIQSVNMLASLSIDILSRGPDARDRKEQVLLALSSPYAESQMELNSFFVAPQSTNFVNLSSIDGAAIPYRFQISVNLQYFSTLTTQVGYYDMYYPVQVTDEP